MRATRRAYKSVFQQKEKTVEELDVGDMCKTIKDSLLRAEEDCNSEILEDMTSGVLFEIIERGEGRRCLILTTSGKQGWISLWGKLDKEALVARIPKPECTLREMNDFMEENCEVAYSVSMRSCEDLGSPMMLELPVGARCQVSALSSKDRRHAQISTETDGIGWIQVLSDDGVLNLSKCVIEAVRPSFNSTLTTGTAATKTSSSSKPKATKSGSLVQPWLDGATSGDIEAMRKLMDTTVVFMGVSSKGPNPNCVDTHSHGETALMHAAAFGRKDIVAFLLNEVKNVDIHHLDDLHQSALHHAAKPRNADTSASVQAEIAQILIKKGAGVDVLDTSHATPLLASVGVGALEVAKVLLDANACVNVKNTSSQTPLDVANAARLKDLAVLLKSNGADGEVAEMHVKKEVAETPVKADVGYDHSMDTAAPPKKSSRATTSNGEKKPPAKKKAVAKKQGSKETLKDPG